MAAERIQKILARSGVASRRGAEQLIADGRVSVDGRTARLGDSADSRRARIEVDGRPIAAAPTAIHLAIHKPRGFLSSARNERGRRSVLALVDVDAERLWPAGRLDVESEGLMLLTNDGEWANRVLHPRFGTVREYAALVVPAANRATLERLRRGVTLDDGPARLLAAQRAPPPDEIVAGSHEAGVWLRVRIGEGRKREVRRIFDAVGLGVERLVRTRIGPLSLDGLHEGEWRHLRPREVAALGGERRQ